MAVSVYRFFRRALRAYQLYPCSSPVRLEAASSFHAELCGLFPQSPDGVSLLFLEDGVSVDGRQVEAFGVEDAGMGAGGDLFNLGVRELRFLIGLSAQELDRFLDPLARAVQGQLNPVDEDLSVLLWEADLPHVWYLLYEERSDGGEERPDPEELTVGPLLTEYLDASADAPSADPGFWVRRLSDEERRRVVAAYRREWEEEVPAKYLRLLLEILRTESRSDESAVLRRTLEQQLEAEASGGRFSVLRRVAERLELEPGATPGAAWALNELAAWFVSPSCLTLLLGVLPARDVDADAVRAFLARMPATLLPEGLAACLESSEQLSPVASAALLGRFEGDPELQSICLRDSRALLRRAALQRVAPAGDDLRRVREIQRDRDPELRVAAIAALARSPQPPLAALADSLYDVDGRVRVAAANAVGALGGRAGLEALLRLMASTGFEERDSRERTAVYAAAGQLAPREVWPILARLAERRRGAWFARRSPVGDPAIEALAQLELPIVRLARERWRRRPDLLAQLDRSQVARTRERTALPDKANGTETEAA